MNVTRKNFDAFKAELKHYLPKAEFYSMDLEMTGIRTNEFESYCDFPYEKYLKVRTPATKYRIIQVGICLYLRTGENEFEARPYNIYVFPRENFGFSPQIAIDSSAADFNTQHKMDWNTWFREGVTYMTLKEAKKKREEIKKSEENPADSAPVKLIKEEEHQKSKEFLEKLEKWIEEGCKEPLIHDEPSRFVRRYIYDVIRKNYPDILAESIEREDNPNEKVIKITQFADENQKNQYFGKKAKEREEFVESQVGFTTIIELLIESKKPLVVHNGYLDMLFIYSHFIEYLPYDYEVFKKNVNSMFPELYDTKFIVNNTKFKNKIDFSSSIDALSKICIQKEDPDFYNPKVTLGDEFKAYEAGNTENARYHEAGYDAYLTGLIFAKMYYALEKEEHPKVKNIINTMRCIYSLKLDQEDFMLKEYFVVVVRNNEKNGKIAPEGLLDQFQEDKIREKVRHVPLSQSGINGFMFILEVESEEAKESFQKRIDEFAQGGLEKLTYEEYGKLRREKYEKGEKSHN